MWTHPCNQPQGQDVDHCQQSEAPLSYPLGHYFAPKGNFSPDFWDCLSIIELSARTRCMSLCLTSFIHYACDVLLCFVWTVCLFSLFYGILFYENATIYLSISPLMDTWVVSSFVQLWIVLLWTSLDTSFGKCGNFGYVLLWVELLGQF